LCLNENLKPLVV